MVDQVTLWNSSLAPPKAKESPWTHAVLGDPTRSFADTRPGFRVVGSSAHTTPSPSYLIDTQGSLRLWNRAGTVEPDQQNIKSVKATEFAVVPRLSLPNTRLNPVDDSGVPMGGYNDSGVVVMKNGVPYPLIGYEHPNRAPGPSAQQGFQGTQSQLDRKIGGADKDTPAYKYGAMKPKEGLPHFRADGAGGAPGPAGPRPPGAGGPPGGLPPGLADLADAIEKQDLLGFMASRVSEEDKQEIMKQLDALQEYAVSAGTWAGELKNELEYLRRNREKEEGGEDLIAMYLRRKQEEEEKGIKNEDVPMAGGEDVVESTLASRDDMITLFEVLEGNMKLSQEEQQKQLIEIINKKIEQGTSENAKELALIKLMLKTQGERFADVPKIPDVKPEVKPEEYDSKEIPKEDDIVKIESILYGSKIARLGELQAQLIENQEAYENASTEERATLLSNQTYLRDQIAQNRQSIFDNQQALKEISELLKTNRGTVDELTRQYAENKKLRDELNLLNKNALDEVQRITAVNQALMIQAEEDRKRIQDAAEYKGQLDEYKLQMDRNQQQLVVVNNQAARDYANVLQAYLRTATELNLSQASLDVYQNTPSLVMDRIYQQHAQFRGMVQYIFQSSTPQNMLQVFQHVVSLVEKFDLDYSYFPGDAQRYMEIAANISAGAQGVPIVKDQNINAAFSVASRRVIFEMMNQGATNEQMAAMVIRYRHFLGGWLTSIVNDEIIRGEDAKLINDYMYTLRFAAHEQDPKLALLELDSIGKLLGSISSHDLGMFKMRVVNDGVHQPLGNFPSFDNVTLAATVEPTQATLMPGIVDITPRQPAIAEAVGVNVYANEPREVTPAEVVGGELVAPGGNPWNPIVIAPGTPWDPIVLSDEEKKDFQVDQGLIRNDAPLVVPETRKERNLRLQTEFDDWQRTLPRELYRFLRDYYKDMKEIDVRISQRKLALLERPRRLEEVENMKRFHMARMRSIYK
jgi:hypothetical protein